MPILHVHLIEGYASATKQRLSRLLTDATRVVVPASAAGIMVTLTEHTADNFMRGGTARVPAPALPDPHEVVRQYLAHMEDRDLASARCLLGAGFIMRFPGAAAMTTLEELIDWAAPRYRSVKKTIDTLDLAPTAGPCVVYVSGTLYGEWHDGTAFDGIRFIDRFELTNGLITRQDVWNDIAEERP
ncbi:MAG: tautomerase [Alphaproteobacteria bacterium MedPE-SWcel]|nr:MAG: tautomerase [Alphaproteobacteria bacterium MedPE-SWcel]